MESYRYKERGEITNGRDFSKDKSSEEREVQILVGKATGGDVS